MKYCDRDDSQRFSVEDLARHCCMSVRNLERLFLRSINRTPREFLASLGIDPENALIVLNSEALSAAELDRPFQDKDRL